MEMKRNQFKETFSQVHASSACLEEVYAMTENRKTTRPRKFIARRLVVLAAGAIALVGSTIAVNAATGNRLLRHFTVIIGGKEYQAEEIEGKENVYQMEKGATITFSPNPVSSGEESSGEEENFEVELELDNETDEASVSVSEPASGVSGDDASADDTSNAK